jgi:hypothetical protein
MRHGFSFARRFTAATLAALSITACFALAAGAERIAGPSKVPASGGNSPQAASGLAVQYANLANILDCLVGPGVAVSNPQISGAAGAFGTFTGGTGIIGFDSGVILSSGNVFNVVGPNQFDNVSTNNGFGGDPDLDLLIPGYVTYDAASVEFDFACDSSVVFSLEYVFGSDEYNEYVGTQFNDVFGFFLDGNTPAFDIAVVPAFCSSPGQAVSINTVNCSNPYNSPFGINCDCYRNNDLQDGGGAINTEMDGLTHVFARTVPITPGTHHIKLAIADAGDRVWDSAVFLRCQSLSCAISTPANRSSWGHLKSLYR